MSLSTCAMCLSQCPPPLPLKSHTLLSLLVAPLPFYISLSITSPLPPLYFTRIPPPLSVSPLLWLTNLPHIFFRITPTLLYLLISFPLSLPLISHFYLSPTHFPLWPLPQTLTPPLSFADNPPPLFLSLTLKLPLPQNTHNLNWSKYVLLSFFIKSVLSFEVLTLWLHCVSVFLETFSCQLDLTWSQGKDCLNLLSAVVS